VRKNVSEILTRKGSVRLGLAFPLHANGSFEESAGFYGMTKIIMKSPYHQIIKRGNNPERRALLAHFSQPSPNEATLINQVNLIHI
jgi:hypothetical protein